MSRGLPPSLDLAALQRIPGFRRYFRYRLHTRAISTSDAIRAAAEHALAKALTATIR